MLTFRVRLSPLRSPHRTAAIDALAEEPNAAHVAFPGTHLRQHFSEHGANPAAA